MKKIKSKDQVIVIAGKDKGKQGRVERVLADGRLVISGVNIVKRHVRPNPQANNPGGIVEKEMPLDASNVAIFNAEKGAADRVGFKFIDAVDGGERGARKKVRYFKSDSRLIDSE